MLSVLFLLLVILTTNRVDGALMRCPVKKQEIKERKII
jgi:hypothetical protein